MRYVCLYIHYTHIYYVNKNVFGKRLIAINRLPALLTTRFLNIYMHVFIF